MTTREEEHRQHRAQVAKQQEQRRAELDYFRQVEAQRQAEREAAEAEHRAFYARVVAHRQAVERGEIDPAAIRASLPTWEGFYREKAEQDRAQAEAEERERRAALSPREVWLSTLPASERRHIATWEHINKMPWPYSP